MCRQVHNAWALASLLSLWGCLGGSSQAYKPPPPVVPDTTLGEGDIFEVTVYGQEDMSGKYRVSHNGTINFPLIGAVMVAGKDQTQVALEIQAALKEQNYLRNPHVSVLIVEMESKRVTVLGAVDSPGSFKVARGMTVLQAISQAGGLTPLADADGAIVTRRVAGKAQRFKVPVGRISEGREEDIEVQSGDAIFVPERIF